MANNRLYLVDTETYEWIMLAKGWAAGWQYWEKTPLEQFLESHTDDVGTPRDQMAALGNQKTKFALFTEADLPKECGAKSWDPNRDTPWEADHTPA